MRHSWRFGALLGGGLAVLAAMGLAMAARADEDDEPHEHVLPMVRPATTAATRATRPATATAPAKAKVSAEAQVILDKVRGAYSKLKSAEFSGTISAEFDLGAANKPRQAQFTASFLSPGQFRHETKGDRVLGSTGKNIYVFDTVNNESILREASGERYAAGAMPSPLSQLLRLASPPGNVSCNPSLLLALAKDAAAEICAGANEVNKVSDVQIDGTAHTVLEIGFASPPMKVTLVFDPRTHLVRRASTDIKAHLEKAGTPHVNSAKIVVDYAKTVVDAPLQPESFAFEPPAGARLVP